VAGVYLPDIDGLYPGNISVDRSEGGSDFKKDVQLIFDGNVWTKYSQLIPSLDTSGFAKKDVVDTIIATSPFYKISPPLISVGGISALGANTALTTYNRTDYVPVTKGSS